LRSAAVARAVALLRAHVLFDSYEQAWAEWKARISVTERGKLVAYLVPAEDTGTLLDRLAKSGNYLPPGAPSGISSRRRWPRKGGDRSARSWPSCEMRNAGDLPRHLRVRQAYLG
jgi:antitoxin (DNA-binding transcriptional repressor) of toxin-antitoxin stability system